VVCDCKTVRRRRRPRALTLTASSSSLMRGLARPSERAARPLRAQTCVADTATARLRPISSATRPRQGPRWFARLCGLSSARRRLARPEQRAARRRPASAARGAGSLDLSSARRGGSLGLSRAPRGGLARLQLRAARPRGGSLGAPTEGLRAARWFIEGPRCGATDAARPLPGGCGPPRLHGPPRPRRRLVGAVRV
jgi:hypothetical protein